jgi:hypothetical protein
VIQTFHIFKGGKGLDYFGSTFTFAGLCSAKKKVEKIEKDIII